MNFYWGDERFVEEARPDRNAVQAEVLLSVLDGHGLDRGRVHAMGSTDEFATPEEAAAAYAQTLAEEATHEGGSSLPVFDVLMLGMGPDSHVASLFPDHAGAATAAAAAVIGVHDSPKPPPLRVAHVPRPSTPPARCGSWLRAPTRPLRPPWLLGGEERANAFRPPASRAPRAPGG